METLEFIEAFFDGKLSQEKKSEFELRITTDPSFAEEVAFYLSLKQAAVNEMTAERERFKGVYAQGKQTEHANDGKQPLALVRKLRPWIVAAAVLTGIIFGLNVWFKPASPERLADKYVQKNFQTLPVKMDNKQDSLQTALRLYNEDQQEEALKYFESIALNDSVFSEAKKYAGIVSLWLGLYDKAINYFSQLENDRDLFANPGKFYRALTLMKRNQPGDKQVAKILLEQVVQNDLEGKETAEGWLKKW